MNILATDEWKCPKHTFKYFQKLIENDHPHCCSMSNDAPQMSPLAGIDRSSPVASQQERRKSECLPFDARRLVISLILAILCICKGLIVFCHEDSRQRSEWRQVQYHPLTIPGRGFCVVQHLRRTQAGYDSSSIDVKQVHAQLFKMKIDNR